MTLNIVLQFIVVLAAIWMGARYSGVGLGLWGAVGLLVLVGLFVWLGTRAVHADPTWRGCATNETLPYHTRSGECGDGRTAPQPTVTPPSPPPVDPPKPHKPPKDEEYEKPGKPHHGGHKGKWG